MNKKSKKINSEIHSNSKIESDLANQATKWELLLLTILVTAFALSLILSKMGTMTGKLESEIENVHAVDLKNLSGNYLPFLGTATDAYHYNKSDPKLIDWTFALECYLRYPIYKTFANTDTHWYEYSSILYLFLALAFLLTQIQKNNSPKLLYNYLFFISLMACSSWLSSSFHYLAHFSFTILSSAFSFYFTVHLYNEKENQAGINWPLLLSVAVLPALFSLTNSILFLFWLSFLCISKLREKNLKQSISQRSKPSVSSLKQSSVWFFGLSLLLLLFTLKYSVFTDNLSISELLTSTSSSNFYKVFLGQLLPNSISSFVVALSLSLLALIGASNMSKEHKLVQRFAWSYLLLLLVIYSFCGATKIRENPTFLLLHAQVVLFIAVAGMLASSYTFLCSKVNFLPAKNTFLFMLLIAGTFYGASDYFSRYTIALERPKMAPSDVQNIVSKYNNCIVVADNVSVLNNFNPAIIAYSATKTSPVNGVNKFNDAYSFRDSNGFIKDKYGVAHVGTTESFLHMLQEHPGKLLYLIDANPPPAMEETLFTSFQNFVVNNPVSIDYLAAMFNSTDSTKQIKELDQLLKSNANLTSNEWSKVSLVYYSHNLIYPSILAAQKSLGKDNNNFDALMNLAMAYGSTDNAATAYKFVQQALQINPKSQIAISAKEELEAKLGIKSRSKN